MSAGPRGARRAPEPRLLTPARRDPQARREPEAHGDPQARRPGAPRSLMSWAGGRVPRALSASQAAVRAVGAAAVIGAALVAGPPPLLLLIAAAAALIAAVRPEPIGAPLSLAALLAVWVLAPRSAGSWTTLAVALAIVVEHTCLVLATGAPPRAAISRALVVRAGGRALVVAAATAVVWLVLAVLPDAGPVPWGAGVAACLALLGAAWALMPPNPGALNERE